MLRLIQTVIGWGWPMRVLGPLIGPFNPFHPRYRIDPYPTYRRMREEHPVHFPRALAGGCVLSRYDDVAAVLGDSRFSANRQNAHLMQRMRPFRNLKPEFEHGIMRSLLMLDPPDHTRLRRLVTKAFTPRVVESLRPRVQALVDELLDAVASRREMELVHDLAYPLPVIVIAALLGVPIEDRDRFKEWSDTLTAILDPLQAKDGLEPCQRAYEELTVYMRGVFEARRREPRDDLISALVAVEEQGQKIDETDLQALVMLILGAGHETTTNLIANAVLALLRNPTERRRLQDDPSLIGTAVEEFLRYDSPVQATDRVAAEDCEIGGRTLRAGGTALLLLGAANRDPRRFSDPDRLDLGRKDNDHLSFGHGIHFCLGAALARVEAQVAVNTLLRRFPDLEGETKPRHWKRSVVLRGPTALPVRW